MQVQKPEEKPRRSHRSYKIAARSCAACHRRKVRCDRGVPCTNCSRYNFTCAYPEDTARRSPSLQGIEERLERVEGMLLRFCGGRTEGLKEGKQQQQQQEHAEEEVREEEVQEEGGRDEPRSCMSWEVLLSNGQAVQYVNNPNIKDLLQDENKIRMTPSRPFCIPQVQNNTPSAPPSPESSSILELYPDPQLALHLWSTYVKCVDPVVKILHIPTTQSAVIATILEPRSAGKSMLALTFAIYYAAVTALSSEAWTSLPVERSVLLVRYKNALDALLLSTESMNRPEMIALQALAIYVTCLRVHETGRSVWVLNGLAIRLAQSLGLHRDGGALNLSPFETELRLRLWWQLCVLDSRAPEDQGFEITFDVLNRGLRLPLNVDDDQLFPAMKNLPAQMRGWTEMSFFLIQTESCRLLHPVLGAGLETGRERSKGKEQVEKGEESISSIRKKRHLIAERKAYIFMQYGISSQSEREDSILRRIAAQHLTTALKKMEFILQLREEISMSTSSQSSRPLPHSFELACDALESNWTLLHGEFSSVFRWLFTTYTQWYALAYVLRCLCSAPCGVQAERAWALVENVFPDMGSDPGEIDQRGGIWKCLLLLRQQALALRVAQGEEEKMGVSGESVSGNANPNVNPGMGMGMGLDEMDLPDIGDDFNAFSGLATDVLFLPEWNAVMNGCLDEMGGMGQSI